MRTLDSSFYCSFVDFLVCTKLTVPSFYLFLITTVCDPPTPSAISNINNTSIFYQLTNCRVRPGPQKPWKSLNFSFQNSRPQKSLNFTKNSQGPWKVLKFSLLCRFHFVWFRVAIVYWKINNEDWLILFLFIPAGCLDLQCVSLLGLGSAAKTLPKLPSDNPVSLLGHIEADRVNVSSFVHFNRANGFHFQVKRLSFDQIMLLKLWENHMIWNNIPGKCSF